MCESSAQFHTFASNDMLRTFASREVSRPISVSNVRPLISRKYPKSRNIVSVRLLVHTLYWCPLVPTASFQRLSHLPSLEKQTRAWLSPPSAGHQLREPSVTLNSQPSQLFVVNSFFPNLIRLCRACAPLAQLSASSLIDFRRLTLVRPERIIRPTEHAQRLFERERRINKVRVCAQIFQPPWEFDCKGSAISVCSNTKLQFIDLWFLTRPRSLAIRPEKPRPSLNTILMRSDDDVRECS